MQNQFVHEPGRLFLENDAHQVVGEILYTEHVDTKVWDVTHTFVDPDFRGQGIAAQLLDALAELARQENVKLKPLCVYVKTAFMRESKYDDVKTH
ncbi:GNAT family N-acetyltransferase [Weissella minor]|nr:GNAT family N-acetyltransferase [Weissella minor]